MSQYAVVMTQEQISILQAYLWGYDPYMADNHSL